MIKRYVFLDDIRYPKDVFNYIPNPIYIEKEWVIVRSYDEFINDVLDNGLSYLYSYDHDLADQHYNSHLLKVIDYDKFTEKTGYSCAKWLVNYCIDNNKELPKYFFHLSISFILIDLNNF